MQDILENIHRLKTKGQPLVSCLLPLVSSPLLLYTSNRAEAAAYAVHASLLALSRDPPTYATISSSPPVNATAKASNALHPRVAVLLGVNVRWHIPLLICRALSTAPAAWWGLRCAFTFLGELLRSDGMVTQGETWSVEQRFRVTEVFLAILWVRRFSFPSNHIKKSTSRTNSHAGSVLRRHIFLISSLIA